MVLVDLNFGVTLCNTDGIIVKNFADGADAATRQKNLLIEMVFTLRPVSKHTTEHTKSTLLHNLDIMQIGQRVE